MRKKLFYLLILCIPVLSGCNASVGTGFFIGPGWGGGPAVGTSIYFYPTIDKSTLTSKDIELINDIKTSAQKSGYTVVDANTSNTIGFKASKHIDNIENQDIDGLPSFVLKDGSRFITVKNGSSKDYYKIKAIVDLTKMNNTTVAKAIADSPASKINLSMKLPGHVTYTNATKKLNNGQSLEWKLIPGKKNLIEADFEMGKTKLNR